MICDKCKAEGKQSKVVIEGGRTTLMNTTEFYDEQGVYHLHNPNVTTTSLRCSNGHTWATQNQHPCPACGK